MVGVLRYVLRSYLLLLWNFDLTPAYTDTRRRSHIRQRNIELAETLSALPGGLPDYTKPATDLEKEALKKR